MGNWCSGTTKPQNEPTVDTPVNKHRKNSHSSEDTKDNGKRNIHSDSIAEDSTAEEASQQESEPKTPIISPTAKENVYSGWKNAILTGNDSLVEVLLEDYPHFDLLEYPFDNGNHALHVAVTKNNKQLTLFLLSNGAQVNAINDDGDIPLHCAVRTTDTKLIALLLKYRGDPGMRNKKGETPRDLARSLHLENIEDLYENHTSMERSLGNNNAHSKLNELHGDIIDEMNADFDDNVNDDLDNDNDDDFNNHEDKHDNTNQLTTEQNPAGPKLSINTVTVLNQISRNDPFRAKKLVQQDTKKILQDMDHVTETKKKLPVLEAWLEKKKPTPPYSWQKRWVLVKDSHILWSDKQRTIEDPSKPEQRKLFNGFLNIMIITEIQALESGSGKKFVLIARDAKRGDQREYVWKAASRVDRDYWVKGLRAHKDHTQQMLDILGH